MKTGQVYYFIAALLFMVALIWLVVPSDARLIATPLFLLAAFCSLMAGRGKSR
jgi:hypothetical protein